MTDYRTGDFLTDGNGLFQITATKESYFLLDVNEGTIDTEFAFTALLEFVKQEYLRMTVDCLKIEEETNND